MNKVLVSWIATNHDFLKRNEEGEIRLTDQLFNEEGPHFSLYKEFGDDFDVHYLLSQDYEDHPTNKWSKLAGTLRNRFGKQVILRFMGIDDVLSVGTIKGKVDELIKYQLKEMDVQVFINPGTPAMQTAWYLIGSELANRNNLTFFKRRERRFLKKGVIPNKEVIKFDNSSYAKFSNIRDNFNLNSLSALNTLITKSIEDTYQKGFKLAGNNSTPVLISGFHGVGKTHLAKYIHENSNRNSQNFTVINCSSYNEEVLQNILFGVEQGAFLGATKLKTGILEQNKGGTVLLKEINRLPYNIQSLLYDVFCTKKVRRIGSLREIEIDVRIISTSTESLKTMCESNLFRWDLYYRLTIAELKLIPFFSMGKKERKQWIDYFFESTYKKLETRFIHKIDKDVWSFLLNHPFKGNIFELSNIIEYFYITGNEKITMKEIPESFRSEENIKSLTLEDVIKKHVKQVVNFCDGNISEASKILNKNRTTIRKYLKSLP